MERKVKQVTGFGGSTSVAEKKPEEKEDIDYTYDRTFKKLFSDKVFLAPVLKNIVPKSTGV